MSQEQIFQIAMWQLAKGQSEQRQPGQGSGLESEISGFNSGRPCG